MKNTENLEEKYAKTKKYITIGQTNACRVFLRITFLLKFSERQLLEEAQKQKNWWRLHDKN